MTGDLFFSILIVFCCAYKCYYGIKTHTLFDRYFNYLEGNLGDTLDINWLHITCGHILIFLNVPSVMKKHAQCETHHFVFYHDSKED